MFFSIGIYHTKTEFNVGTLFRSATNFGAHSVFTVGRRYKRKAADTVNTPNQMPVYNYSDLDDLKAHLPLGCPLVAVELSERAQPLDRFTHPVNAVYLLGAEDHGIPERELKKCHSIVQIPYTTSCLNVAVAGSILLYDRAMKMANRYNTDSAYYVPRIPPVCQSPFLFPHQQEIIAAATGHQFAADFETIDLDPSQQPVVRSIPPKIGGPMYPMMSDLPGRVGVHEFHNQYQGEPWVEPSEDDKPIPLHNDYAEQSKFYDTSLGEPHKFKEQD